MMMMMMMIRPNDESVGSAFSSDEWKKPTFPRDFEDGSRGNVRIRRSRRMHGEGEVVVDRLVTISRNAQQRRIDRVLRLA